MRDLINRADVILALLSIGNASPEDHEDYVANEMHDKCIEIVHAMPTRKVGIKPLEWVDYGEEPVATASAKAPFMDYVIVTMRSRDFTLFLGDVIIGVYPSVETAKAAAQADYAARIRSALTATPAQDVAGLVMAALERPDVMAAMVAAAETAHSQGVSFNVVIGRATRAAIARMKEAGDVV